MTVESFISGRRVGKPAVDLADLLAQWVPAWTVEAVCASTDPELFYPPKGKPNDAARAVCNACPVQAECLEEALKRNERYGIWGGLSENQRRGLRRR